MTMSVTLPLMYEDGVFLKMTPFQKVVKDTTESEETLAEAEQKIIELEAEFESY